MIQKLDATIKEKLCTVDQLVADLKEENLIGLSLVSEDNRMMTNFHRRSGSTRKIIGSPRELGNAVATNKNPNGIWV